MLARDPKIEKEAPCLYLEWNERKNRHDIAAPAVNCGFNCKNCGWNPKETERRLEDGIWCKDDNGKMHLVFPKRSAVSNAVS